MLVSLEEAHMKYLALVEFSRDPMNIGFPGFFELGASKQFLITVEAENDEKASGTLYSKVEPKEYGNFTKATILKIWQISHEVR